MAKAIIVVGSTQVVNNEAIVSYTASIIKTAGKDFSYSSDYQLDTSINLANNLLAWRNKIIAEAAEKQVVLLTTDVIIFGIPN